MPDAETATGRYDRGRAMSAARRATTEQWKAALVAVGGLIVAILVAGLVGLGLNHAVEQVTDEALYYDVELEDRGDDLRVAVLDVRHYHRNLAFAGPSRGAVADFERAYGVLLAEIDRLEQLGVRAPEAPQPAGLRALARGYYEEFRPAVDGFDSDSAQFVAASDRGLVRLAELDRAAQQIDRLGEDLAVEALASIERATATARLVLLVVIGGLVLAGMVLAYAVMRIVREMRDLNGRERAASLAVARAASAKLDFLTDVSHELRTPLTVLRGNAEVSLKLDRDCPHADLMREIARESRRMSRLVDDLLFLARSDGASPPLSVELVPVEPFLAELAARAEAVARERGAGVRLDLQGGGDLRADPGRLEQAVVILVDNAAKYGPPGGPVRLRARTHDGELAIDVVDHGPGIPRSDLGHVFERYYRGRGQRHSGAGRTEGTGLGLSIAATIARAHGGRIDAWSRVGEGTRMSLRVPLSPVGTLDAASRSRITAAP